MSYSNDRTGLEPWELTPWERVQSALRRLNHSFRDADLGWEAFLAEDGDIYIRLSPKDADAAGVLISERLEGCQLEHVPTEGQLDFWDELVDPWLPPSLWEP